jgi:hypothetical protein
LFWSEQISILDSMSHSSAESILCLFLIFVPCIPSFVQMLELKSEWKNILLHLLKSNVLSNCLYVMWWWSSFHYRFTVTLRWEGLILFLWWSILNVMIIKVISFILPMTDLSSMHEVLGSILYTIVKKKW